MNASVRWLATHEDGSGVFRIGRDAEEYVAEWTGVATLRARAGGASARLTFVDGCPDDVRQKIEQGPVMLLLRHLRGEIALHGAAVAKHGRALLILGKSGDGKSTLAHALVEEHGWQLLSDDAISLDGTSDEYHVAPTESVVWLADDGPMKRAHAARQVASSTLKLAGAVRLAFSEDDALTLTPVAPLSRARTWVQSFVRFALDDRQLLAQEAARVGELSERVTMLELRRPRDLSRLGQASGLLAAVLGTLPEA